MPRTRSFAERTGSAIAGGAIERGVSGPTLESGLGTRLDRGGSLSRAGSRLAVFFARAGGCRLASFLAGVTFLVSFTALTAAFLAVATFLRGGATLCLVLDLCLDLVVLARATFLALAEASFLVGDFLGFAATFFLGNRRLVDCWLEAERFDTLLVGLLRTAVTRLLIMAGFQRERLSRDLRAYRRL